MALAAYHVVGNGMTIETQLNAAGTGIEDVHVVPYVIDSGPARGQRRTVKVPQSEFTPDGVKLAVESDLNNAHLIAGLGQASPAG